MIRQERDHQKRPSGHVIVGRVTPTSATIWVKGAKRCASADIELIAMEPKTPDDERPSGTVMLDPSRDNTGVIRFDELHSDTCYTVTARFRVPYGLEIWDNPNAEAVATFWTAPDGAKGEKPAFSFLLGSCNLSIVSVNNLAARALQIIGAYASRQSLLRPIDADQPQSRPGEFIESKFGRWWMRSRIRRKIIDWMLKLSVGAVFVGTAGKWPKQPLLRSPFMKLEALFAGKAIHFRHGFKPPMPGAVIKGSLSGATGTLTFTPKPTSGQWQEKDERGRYPGVQPVTTDEGDLAEGSLVLVDVEDDFVAGDRLYILTEDDEDFGPTDRGTVGYVTKGVTRDEEGYVTGDVDHVADVRSDYGEPPPRFTIHAGDQIYFDFPDTKRPPKVARYHEAYREAWFEDRYQRAFLARGAHYMTLDDHEIVDQFSLGMQELEEAPERLAIDQLEKVDPPPVDAKEMNQEQLRARLKELTETIEASSKDSDEPTKTVPRGYKAANFSVDTYLDAAKKAYRHYVQRRQDDDLEEGETEDEKPLHFTFEHGHAQFFMLDTRTERRKSLDESGEDPDPNTRMISKEQMVALEKWLVKYRHTLKFVISSVPFIAEVLPEHGVDVSGERPDRSDDKWSGAPYRRQRDEIIELINDEEIENLVFLVGDMHCAYHASMTIGEGRRWHRRCIHELAGGPIYQLQHGRRRQFATAVARTTRRSTTPYDIRLHHFHSGANAVMHIKVPSVDDDGWGVTTPALDWRVIRTMTEFDGGPWFGEERGKLGTVDDRSPISGRIVLRPALSPEDDTMVEAAE